MPSFARTYARFLGIVFVAIALIELLGKNVANLLVFTTVHNVIHWTVGVLGLIVGFAGNGKGARTYAQVFGIVFAIIAVVGFLTPDFLAMVLGYRMNWLYHVVHIVAAVGGLWAGFKKSA